MKWTVPILMLLLLTMTFSKAIIWFQYQANKDFISKNLCINKSRPILHCNGKCQMMKKMAQEEQGSSSAPAPKLKNGFDETALPVTNEFKSFAAEIKTANNSKLRQTSYETPVFPVFHPPA